MRKLGALRKGRPQASSGDSGSSSGPSHSSVGRSTDPEFDRLHQHFHTAYTALKGFEKEVNEFVKSMNSQMKAIDSSLEGFNKLFAGLEGSEGDMVKELIADIAQLSQTKASISDELESHIRKALQSYLMDYTVMNKRVSERNSREKKLEGFRKDLDKARNARNRDEMKIKVAQVKVEHSEPVYETLNTEVIEDMRRLEEQLPNFITPFFACWSSLQYRFYADVVAKWENCLRTLGDISITAHLDLPSVITPAPESAINANLKEGASGY